MKKIIICILITSFYYTVTAQNVAQGEKSFKSLCAACHSVGKGKVVGPDLAGVTTKRNEKWLISWIKSSQTMVKNNDPIAVKLFNEYNKMPMPDANLTPAQIKDVLAYIKSLSPAAKPNTKTNQVTPLDNSTGGNQKTNTAPPKKLANKDWIKSDYSIKCVKSETPIDPKKLDDSKWGLITAVKVPVAPQNIAYPTLTNATVDSLYIKSMHSKNQVAFLFQWKDTSKNTEVEVDQFCDAFAVQFPVNPANIPSYMMGNPGGMVHIVHWKGVWQEDCENGFQDVQKKYPNMWVDVYPGMEDYIDRSKRAYAQDVTAEYMMETHSYANMPATYSGNPMSIIKRKQPVEEASAEGFGTIATQESQQAQGWASWKNGKWTVCIVVPVNTGSDRKAVVNDITKVAFAIWDGGNKNIGGRKHFIPWVDLIIEQ